MEDQDLSEIINQVLDGYRKEVSSMLHDDLSLLSTIDWVFFSGPEKDLSRDFIDGFCLALIVKYVNALICLDKGIYVSKTLAHFPNLSQVRFLLLIQV